MTPGLRLAPRMGIALALLVAMSLATLAETDTPDGDLPPPLKERIAVGLSKDDVDITADFSGEEILVYGAIERSRFLLADESPPDVILTVKGPERQSVVRRKNRTLGLWVNRAHTMINSVPSFYAVSSTRPLEEILGAHQIDIHDLTLEEMLLAPGDVSDGSDPKVFRDAAIRLLRDSGYYLTLPGSVRVPGDSLFSTRIRLPANIVEGDYLLRIFLVRDGDIIDNREIVIPVRRAAFEQWIYRAAQDDPLSYALVSILVAILAGWAASALFRRIRI